MKKICLVLIFAALYAVTACAQEEEEQGFILYDSSDYDFERKWERLYENVNLELVNTGFFMDRAVNFG